MSSDEKQRDVSGVVTSTSTNEKGASEASKKQTPLKLDVWTVVLIVAGVFLLVTAVGGYIFNWNWTGFQGNTLWDWFKLLLLPVVLGTAKLTYRGHQKRVGGDTRGVWGFLAGDGGGRLSPQLEMDRLSRQYAVGLVDFAAHTCGIRGGEANLPRVSRPGEEKEGEGATVAGFSARIVR